MKKLLFLLSLLFTCFVWSQETVMIKTIETYGTFAAIKKEIHIIEGDKEVKTITLENKHNAKGIPKNMKVIKSVLDTYLLNNYELISSEAVSFGWNGVFTIEHTYLLKNNN